MAHQSSASLILRNVLNHQLTRFILVGVASNGIAYLAYILMALVIRPVVAMSILYAVAFVLSFWGNRTFTFNHKSGLLQTVFRFTLMHALLFSLQYGMHSYGVSYLGYPHQAVQAVSTILIGILSYIISRKLVFRTGVTRLMDAKNLGNHDKQYPI